MNIQANIQEQSTGKDTERHKALLLGGAGFLGKGLASQLARRNCLYIVIDISDMDLSDARNIPKLASYMHEEKFNSVFLLASQIGSQLFQSDQARIAGGINRKIYENTMAALLTSGLRDLELFYYSTSEVYWSMPSSEICIDDHMVPGAGVDRENPRSVYAMVKLYAERNLQDRMKFFNIGDFRAINVIRPFNVYGPGQRRGVMYSMLRSGISGEKIRYSEDTTRTLTSLSYISEKTIGLMGRTGFRAVNMSNGFSVDMKTLAQAVRQFLIWKFGDSRIGGIEPMPPDMSIRYRQASAVMRDPDAVFEILKQSDDMHRLSEEIMYETRGIGGRCKE